MSSRSILVSIDAVSKSLPFGVDEYKLVNETYRRWVEQGHAEDRRRIEIWTYCYVQRFFAVQFLRWKGWMRSDADRLIDVTLRRLRGSRYQIRNPDRYTSWVASTCRNTLVTHIRGYHLDGIDDPDSIVAEPRRSSPLDVSAMYRALENGIERLPEYLKPAARLRLLDGRPYREISRRTGRPVATMRSYANKALVTLRQDPEVKKVFDEMRE
jgi:DNA-directed RNA polymerase specialized sigma24 family protein